jgi:hypothetical protein
MLICTMANECSGRVLLGQSSRRIQAILGILVLCYVATCVYFKKAQVRIILAPLAEIPTDPERMGIAYDPVTIPILDKSEREIGHLDAYWVPAEAPDAPVFLYLHTQQRPGWSYCRKHIHFHL